MPAITPPQTTTITNHGLFITVNGQVIGAINEWAPSQTHTVTPVFEFGSVTTGVNDVPAKGGEPYENVPGNITGTEITIARYDIYTAKFELVFGTDDLIMLSSQSQPLQFREFIQAPDGSFAEQKVFYGVWFTRLGRRHDSKGDRIVMVNASAAFTRIRRAA